MASTTQTRIDMRVSEQIKTLAERAAAASGCSVTEYISRLVQNDAPKVLNQLHEIELTNQQFDHFAELCARAPTPSTRLRQAARRLDQEGF
jgi:uncharacterized protein (DUF1778 family)